MKKELNKQKTIWILCITLVLFLTSLMLVSGEGLGFEDTTKELNHVEFKHDYLTTKLEFYDVDDTQLVTNAHYYIKSDLIAFNTPSRPLYAKPVTFVEEYVEVEKYDCAVVKGNQTCLTRDVVKEREITKTAKLSFVCDTGGSYKIVKYDGFASDKDYILKHGVVYGYQTCTNNLLEFDVDSLSSYTITSAELIDGVVSYWKFDENDGTIAEDVGGGNNGTISGATWTTSGKISNALSFDGDDYVDTGIKPSIHNNYMTIAGWFYIDGGADYLWGSWDSTLSLTQRGFSLRRINTTNTFALTMSNNYAFFGYADTGYTDKWVHIVVVAKGNDDIYLYLDGSLVSDATAGTAVSIDDNIRIGIRNQDGVVGHHGEIDEVGIWNRALNSTEVETLYDIQKDGFESGQYPFEALDDVDSVAHTFVSQTPDDMNILNILDGVDVVYNITNVNQTEPVYLNVTYLSTATCKVYIAGVCYRNITEYYKIQANTPYTDDLYEFTIFDFNLIPGTYNIDEEYMINANKSFLTISPNQKVKIELNNLDVDAEEMFLEAYLNTSLNNVDVVTYYCNNNYISGKIDNSPYCSIFGAFRNITNHHHTHGNNSFHNLLRVPVFNGTIGGIPITTKSYFVLSSSESFDVAYIENNTDTIQRTNNDGTTYTSLLGTIDLHVHQYRLNDGLSYQSCATGGTDNELSCSNVRTDYFNAVPFEYEPPIFILLYPTTAHNIETMGATFDIEWFGLSLIDEVLTYDVYINDIFIVQTTGTTRQVIASDYVGNNSLRFDVNENGTITQHFYTFEVIESVVSGGVSVVFDFEDTNKLITFVIIFMLLIFIALIGLGLNIPPMVFMACFGGLMLSLKMFSLFTDYQFIAIFTGLTSVILLLYYSFKG